MGQIASLSVRIGADLGQFQKAMGRVQSSLERASSTLTNLGSTLTSRVSLPIIALGGASVLAAAKMESLQLALNAVAGSSAEAEAQMKRLRVIAQNPGIDFEQAIRGSVALQSVGIAAGVAEEALKGVANAVALGGGGTEQFASVVRQLQQVASRGKLMGEELNVILENAPAIAPALEEAFGSASADKIRALNLTTEQFFAALTGGLATLPRVESGLSNALNNLQASATQALATIGASLNDLFDITGKAERLAATLGRVSDAVADFAKSSPALARLALLLAGAAAAAGPLLLALGTAAKIGGIIAAGFAAATGPIGLTVVAIGAAGVAIAALYQKSEAFRKTVGRVWDGVRASIESAMDAAAAAVKQSLEAMRRFWEVYGGVIVRVASIVFGQVARVIGGIVSGIASLVGGVLNLLTGNFSAAFESLKRVVLSGIKVVGGGFLSFVETILLGAGVLAEKVPYFGERLGTALGGAADAVAALRARLDGLGGSGSSGGTAALSAVSDAASGLAGIFKNSVTPAIGGAAEGIERLAESMQRLYRADQERGGVGGGLALPDMTAFDLLQSVPEALEIIKAKAQEATEKIATLGETFRTSISEGAGDAINRIVDGFADALAGVKSFHDALKGIGSILKQVLSQIVAALVKLALFKAISLALGSPTTGFGAQFLGGLGQGLGVSNVASSAPATTTLRGGDIIIAAENSAQALYRQGVRSPLINLIAGV